MYTKEKEEKKPVFDPIYKKRVDDEWRKDNNWEHIKRRRKKYIYIKKPIFCFKVFFLLQIDCNRRAKINMHISPMAHEHITE